MTVVISDIVQLVMTVIFIKQQMKIAGAVIRDCYLRNNVRRKYLDLLYLRELLRHGITIQGYLSNLLFQKNEINKRN